MNIEKDVFNRYVANFDKLIEYGFVKDNDIYKYSKNFMDDSFRAEVIVKNNGEVSGKVYDLELNEEYINIRIWSNQSEFVGKVREEYRNILTDIRNKCFKKEYFITKQANRITKLIKDIYGDEPEFIWEKFPGYGVFRNPNNGKWYGLIMNIDKNKIDKKGHLEVEILNVKLDENEIHKLLDRRGFYQAYHMNKENWITIILDDVIADDEIIKYIEESHGYTEKVDEWLVPANAKYYDIINCFNDNDTIIWKQSNKIKVGDIVYLYVAEPYSCILYKCVATKVDIPYEYQDKNVSMKKVMEIKLLKRYDKDKFTFKVLNDYGITSIKGPRSITDKLSKELNRI